MAEEVIKRRQKELLGKTIRKLEKDSFYCAAANGKLSQVATAIALDRGTCRIVKSVYEKISKEELENLLSFKDAPTPMMVVLEIWFWRQREREPFERKKFFFNQPNQDIQHISNLVKN